MFVDHKMVQYVMINVIHAYNMHYLTLLETSSLHFSFEFTIKEFDSVRDLDKTLVGGLLFVPLTDVLSIYIV